ncbi:selenocysteine insertion sequence-binding protein 2-like isoform X2 [Hypomesus transpacificus]|uniref:selenocysteine insertion sequence-binding protein 2-like isoform X2 n=1 Tax=Hypomesus transpacificus TaxID=137520 RepID=UPI001F084E3B|nr:selenocysteine insertion sequence-binding protein 2-like isoform X2 [Hypomesus transpacificus]
MCWIKTTLKDGENLGRWSAVTGDLNSEEMEMCSLKVLQLEGSPSRMLLRLMGERGCTLGQLVDILQTMGQTEALKCVKPPSGLDEALHNIIDTCREQAVPFVFALSRKALGRCVNKAVPVSLVGVFNYDGAQDHYHKMIELSSEARRAYEVMIENLEMTSQAEQEDLEAHPNTEPQPPPCSEEVEEPEYIKLWKKMLKNECNHKLLNFEEKYKSSSAASDSKAQMTEEEAS